MDDLEARLRAQLPAGGRTEQRMFGGLCFMLEGNMVAGTSKRGLLLRVGPQGQAEALARGAVPMEMAGRVAEGFVYAPPDSFGTDEALREWLKPALAFVRTLPPKAPGEARKKAKPKGG